MPSKSKQKGNRFEYEVVDKLKARGMKDVKRAYGSNGLSLPGCAEDVDLLADGVKIQCKVRKTTPKWLEIGTCDMVVYKQDRGEIFVLQKLEDIDVSKRKDSSS